MRKILFLILLNLFLFNEIYSQCQQWDETTTYQVGEKVIYTNKAYEALVNIWYWPPPHPIYWTQVPVSNCISTPSQNLLNLYVGDTAGFTVILDTFPDGSVGSVVDTAMFYDNNAYVTLTAYVQQGYEFCSWWVLGNDTMFTLEDTVLNIEIKDTVEVSCSVRKLLKFDVIIGLSSNGKVIVDTLPTGIIDTFDQSDGRSVLFNYYENNKITLTALPDSAYELIDWGDPRLTVTNPLDIELIKNYQFMPIYDIAALNFRVPALCNTGDHMRVEGRSKFYGASEFRDGLIEKGTILLRDKLTSNFCEITNNSISLGNTFLFQHHLISKSIDSYYISALTGKSYHLLTSDSIITHHLYVDVNSFPDYVFAENYKLKPINEVESYIKDFGHLPGLPSAEEVKRDNINLGEMYTILLEKVENMALYIIELNEELSKLEKEGTCIK